MFDSIRFKLTVFYVLTFLIGLLGFALVVRVLYERSLNQRFNDQLATLAHGAISSVEADEKILPFRIDYPVQLLSRNGQGLEWFDSHGRRLAAEGLVFSGSPFSTQRIDLFEDGEPELRGLTLPVINADSGRLIGYLRSTQSLQDVRESMRRLDLVIIVSLGFSLLFASAGGWIFTRQAMKPIVLSYERMKSFIADASHELRSPIMVIASNTQVALRYPEGIREADAQKLHTIMDAAHQMKQLTDHLLILARSDEDLSHLCEVVHLNTMLPKLIDDYQEQAQNLSIHLVLRMEDALDTLGLESELRRVFANLIDNAFAFTSAGGEISIAATHNDRQLQISVSDTGIGMSEETQARIFDRFWRADTSRSYRSGGAGLGLAIVEAIVRNHGGSVGVVSRLGVGSRFDVRLPSA